MPQPGPGCSHFFITASVLRLVVQHRRLLRKRHDATVVRRPTTFDESTPDISAANVMRHDKATGASGASCFHRLMGKIDREIWHPRRDRQTCQAISIDDSTPTKSVALVALTPSYVPQGVLIGRRGRRVVMYMVNTKRYVDNSRSVFRRNLEGI